VQASVLPNPGSPRQVWCVSRHDDVPAYLRKINIALSRRSRALPSACAPATFPLSVAGLEFKPASVQPATDGAEGSGAGVDANREEVLLLAEDDALLCPGGDVPMRLAVASVADLQRLAEPGARPRPRLAAAQRRGGWPDGTVLLLGRSGTGKTVCLCEQMVADREQAAALGVGLRQLFVARSPRMCALVRGIQVA
jgi:hypothetical protein